MIIYNNSIKVYFIFSNRNFSTKIIYFKESFQHENVFGACLTSVYFFILKIYINLTFEVKIQANKLILT